MLVSTALFVTAIIANLDSLSSGKAFEIKQDFDRLLLFQYFK